MRGGNGMLAFLAGFGNGYTTGKEKQRKRKREDERFALEKERAELQLEPLRDARKMREELNRLDQDAKPTDAYVVTTPDGKRFIYTDPKMAEDTAAGLEGAAVTPTIVVQGQTFANKEDAQLAADRMNSPASRLAREAKIYMKYQRPDLARSTYDLYQKELETNRQAVQSAMLEFAERNDIQGAANFYNDKVLDGRRADVKVGPDGSVTVADPSGKAQAKTFPNAQAFWQETLANVARSPANLFESVKFDKEMGLRERGVAVQEGQLANDTARTGAQVSHLNAQTADIPAQARDRATQAGAAATSAGASALNAQTSRAALTKPTISAAPDAKGGLNFVQTQPIFDPKTGTFTMSPPVVQPAAGLQYPAGYVANQRANAMGLGGLGLTQPQVDPAAVQSVMEQLQSEARRRANARTLGPAASGVVQ